MKGDSFEWKKTAEKFYSQIGSSSKRAEEEEEYSEEAIIGGEKLYEVADV